MDIKDELEIKNKKIDNLQKKSDIIYKQSIILLATSGGSGTYWYKFFEIKNYLLSTIFGLIFILIAIGLISKYNELKSLNDEVKRILND